jgi:hypothetical protein
MPDHKCRKNHKGSSKSMEPQACLEMVINLYNDRSVVVEQIVLDDDSSTRALLKWNNADWMNNNNTNTYPMAPKSKGKNKGDLQRCKDTGRPLWLADPNHRRNVLTGELIRVTKEGVGTKATITKMDVTRIGRIGKNFSYMIRPLPRIAESEYDSVSKAILNHHFNDHTYCGPWCPSKRGLALQGFYRSKTKDAVLYNRLEPIVAKYITVDRLKELTHGMDTQVNESLNNTFSLGWLLRTRSTVARNRSETDCPSASASMVLAWKTTF